MAAMRLTFASTRFSLVKNPSSVREEPHPSALNFLRDRREALALDVRDRLILSGNHGA